MGTFLPLFGSGYCLASQSQGPSGGCQAIWDSASTAALTNKLTAMAVDPDGRMHFELIGSRAAEADAIVLSAIAGTQHNPTKHHNLEQECLRSQNA